MAKADDKQDQAGRGKSQSSAAPGTGEKYGDKMTPRVVDGENVVSVVSYVTTQAPIIGKVIDARLEMAGEVARNGKEDASGENQDIGAFVALSCAQAISRLLKSIGTISRDIVTKQYGLSESGLLHGTPEALRGLGVTPEVAVEVRKLVRMKIADMVKEGVVLCYGRDDLEPRYRWILKHYIEPLGKFEKRLNMAIPLPARSGKYYLDFACERLRHNPEQSNGLVEWTSLRKRFRRTLPGWLSDIRNGLQEDQHCLSVGFMTAGGEDSPEVAKASHWYLSKILGDMCDPRSDEIGKAISSSDAASMVIRYSIYRPSGGGPLLWSDASHFPGVAEHIVRSINYLLERLIVGEHSASIVSGNSKFEILGEGILYKSIDRAEAALLRPGRGDEEPSTHGGADAPIRMPWVEDGDQQAAESWSLYTKFDIETQKRLICDDPKRSGESEGVLTYEEGQSASATLVEALEDDSIATLARELSTEQQLRLSEEFRRAGAFSKLREVLDMEPGAVAPEDEVEVLNEHLAKLHEQKKFADASITVHQDVIHALRDYSAAVGGYYETLMKRKNERVRVTLGTIEPQDGGQAEFAIYRQGGNGRLIKHRPEMPYLQFSGGPS